MADRPRTLIVDRDYLNSLKDNDKWEEALKQDITDLFPEEVSMIPPMGDRNLYALYPDAFAIVCRLAAEMGYKIRVNNKYDAMRVKSILGPEHVDGDPESGYIVRRADLAA